MYAPLSSTATGEAVVGTARRLTTSHPTALHYNSFIALRKSHKLLGKLIKISQGTVKL